MEFIFHNVSILSIKISFVQDAIRHALISCTQYRTDHINMIVELVNFSINNAVIHYRGGWYSHKEGIPTGGSDSVVTRVGESS